MTVFNDPWFPWLAGLLVVWAVLFWFRVSSRGALAVSALENAAVSKLDDATSHDWMLKALDINQIDPHLLTQHEFFFLGAYKVDNAIGDPIIVAWHHKSLRSHFRVMLVSQRSILELVTALNVGQLRTSNAREAQLYPPLPESWIQSFDDRDASSLIHRHHAATVFLRETTGQTPAIGRSDFDADFVRNMRLFTTYLKSIFMWKARIPYWYFVRQNILYGKSVMEQYKTRRRST